MWLRIHTNEKSPKKFWVEEDPTNKKVPVKITTSYGTELRLSLEEADSLCKELNYLLMDKHFREVEK